MNNSNQSARTFKESIELILGKMQRFDCIPLQRTGRPLSLLAFDDVSVTLRPLSEGGLCGAGLVPDEDGENCFFYRDLGGESWRATISRKNLENDDFLIRIEFLQKVWPKEDASVVVYELYWPKGADLPVLQHAARGYLIPKTSHEEVRGRWVTQTEDLPSCEFTPDGVRFAVGCRGHLTKEESAEQFLSGVRYLEEQTEGEPRRFPGLEMD